MQTTVTLANGRELDVEWELEPASGDGITDQKSPECIEIIAVTQGWLDAETTDEEDTEILANLWHELHVSREDYYEYDGGYQ